MVGVVKADATPNFRTQRAAHMETACQRPKTLLVRLEMLPEQFHQHWHFLGLRDRGLPEIVRHAIKMAPALVDEKESA